MPRAPKPVPSDERYIGLARTAARAADEMHADEVAVLDMRSVCNFADFFVLATCTSHQQMKGVAKEIQREMSRERAQLLARNGMDTGKWLLLDYGEIVIHLFDTESRAYYQIEDLWGDAKRLDWQR